MKTSWGLVMRAFLNCVDNPFFYISRSIIMFCSQCGTSVASNAKFCNSCGCQLANNEVPTSTHVDVAPKRSLLTNVPNQSFLRHEIGICLHCGFKGEMGVEVVVAPGHENWKAPLIGGILFSILFLFLMTEGVSPFAFLIPLGFFLFSAYSYSQKMECFHCSSCHEISYKSNNGTWSKEKDSRKWYMKSWTDSSLPFHQKIILFVALALVFGFLRFYLDGRG